jgi:uncharacterized protein involved in copper resistance
MKAVARGRKSPPKDAGGISFDSVGALLRLLTPQNRALLGVIRDKKPQSIAELAELTGIRLRYEFWRKFAPYIGVNYRDVLGPTANYARQRGATSINWTFVVGLRSWL